MTIGLAAQVVDPLGVCGSILHYALVILLVGSSMLIFLYLWRKGRLDMDEGPKYQMMDDEQEGEKNDKKP